MPADNLTHIEDNGGTIPVTPGAAAVTRALAEIGAALQAQGLTLEDMIERGRMIRHRLYDELYGSADADAS